MSKFKILPGLPAYGPLPEQFSSTGMGKHSEGYIVEFYSKNGQKWVGNFQPGMGHVDEVFEHPDGKNLIVVSAGQAYVIEPETRTLITNFGGQIEHVISLPESQMLIFGNGLWFEAIGSDGFLWKTQRISWDGMRSIRNNEVMVTGEAYDPMTDSWLSFSVDLCTGKSTGGSYNGP